MNEFFLKKYSVLFFWLLSCLFAFGQEDHYFHFFFEYEGERYFLSAVDGGGDEVIAKKGVPGEYEKFHLQYTTRGDSGERLYRVRTANNYYLAFNEDSPPTSEKKEYSAHHLFEVKEKKRIDQKQDHRGGSVLTHTKWELRLTRQDSTGQRYWLGFIPELEEFGSLSSPQDTLSMLQGEEIRIETLAVHFPVGEEHEYRFLFDGVDSTSRSCLYKQEIYAHCIRGEPEHIQLYPGVTDVRVRFRGEVGHIDIKYKGDDSTSCPVPRLIFFKDGRQIQSWKFEEPLQNGERVYLDMSGRIEKY